ncbi:MAG TPA: flavodoxin-dependent (E)-4-hydroxy-3-methylbut-2-enyl-diphosphate synthase [Candidatus Omnitrophota bacterium]|nr:flavodoxin-dependent (E)-4-hydroxy-3-methylbut-2-enyl-diphosphate synthase [Candidatus Omnitrophota bacterium]HPD85364.1 flavodoxin-dependent (E)-4-hydroxy-3-methylbut-2-enyl-diphosphate synthase [Candidatus Omnitrophota bacterium]HRZ04135.1 flavodoxin-dependent (E)-4-hydroxy-3-methylbut-2-enyl-diphosphate synthase [Candidatus Omnitrophota bacterium]
MSEIKRRKTPSVPIGNLVIGSRHPIAIQSMTNTPTADIPGTVRQVKELIDAGSELVRITVDNEAAAKATVEIISQLRAEGYTAPIIGDFHFNGHILLSKHPQTAKWLDKYRINPGNVGKGKGKDDNFSTIIKIAADNNKAVRIGVNWGSLDQELLTELMVKNARARKPKSGKEIVCDAMIKSALDSASAAIKLGLKKEKLVLSVKLSGLQDMVAAYEGLARACDYVLHLGLTESGSGTQGITASTASLAILLQQGIGDTIRISLTPEPNTGRTLEVETCKALLQSMGLRYFAPSVTTCPGCGRTNSDYFQQLAKDINTYVAGQMPAWKRKHKDIEQLKIAVMGCVVNGPGESRHADIGISLPGATEKPVAPVYVDGKQYAILKGEKIKEEFVKILEDYIRRKYKK